MPTLEICYLREIIHTLTDIAVVFEFLSFSLEILKFQKKITDFTKISIILGDLANLLLHYKSKF